MSTEWSSIESGWTAYIAPSDHEDDDDEDWRAYKQEGVKREAEEVDSDGSSMASDASSGPSDQYGHHSLGHAKNKNERKDAAGKKKQQEEEKKKKHGEQIKAAKDKADSAGKSKKR